MVQTLISLQEEGLSAPFQLDDRIFLGEGLFETIRVSEGKPYYARLHWQRLQKSALFLELPFSVSCEEWQKSLYACIRLKQLKEGGIKAILGSGPAARGLAEKSLKSQLVFTAFHYSINSSPLTLNSAPWQRDSNNPIYQLKSVNYLEAILARRHAQAAGVDDLLFFNSQGQAMETTIANLFLIKNNQLFTPSLKSGLLAGITRQRILALARKNGVLCFECELEQTNLLEAEALFLCNALQGIRPVSVFDGQTSNSEHPLIKDLQELWRQDEPFIDDVDNF